MTQLSAANGGKFRINWIPLGYGELLGSVLACCAARAAPRSAWEVRVQAPDAGLVWRTVQPFHPHSLPPGASTACPLCSRHPTHPQFTHTVAGENWKLQKLAERVKFSDIFATAPFNPATGCPVGFKSINADDVGAECLQLKVGP